jgi:hypothetical protein
MRSMTDEGESQTPGFSLIRPAPPATFSQGRRKARENPHSGTTAVASISTMAAGSTSDTT